MAKGTNVRRTKATRRFPKGRWEAKYRTPDGQHRSKTFDLEEDAQRFARKMRRQMDVGEYVDSADANTPYRIVLEEWYSSLIGVKPRTLASYRGIINSRLLPAFGDEPVRRITRAAVQRYLASMEKEGKKPQTIRNCFFAIQASLSAAVEFGYINANPVIGLSKKLAHSTFKGRFFEHDALDRLAAALPEPYPTLAYFAAYTGLRAGEVYALLVQDLDLLHKTVSVTKSRAVAGPSIVTPTKTGDERTTNLPQFLVDLLRSYLDANPRLPTAPLFDFPTGPRGGNGYNRWYTGVFEPAVRRAGFPPGFNFHSLRHTTVVYALETGEHPRAVADHVGHKTTDTTMKVYAHTSTAAKERLTAGLERAYREAK